MELQMTTLQALGWATLLISRKPSLLAAILLTDVFRNQNQVCFQLSQRTAFNVNSTWVITQAALVHFETRRKTLSILNLKVSACVVII